MSYAGVLPRHILPYPFKPWNLAQHSSDLNRQFRTTDAGPRTSRSYHVSLSGLRVWVPRRGLEELWGSKGVGSHPSWELSARLHLEISRPAKVLDTITVVPLLTESDENSAGEKSGREEVSS
jgi:hypothetical protein